MLTKWKQWQLHVFEDLFILCLLPAFWWSLYPRMKVSDNTRVVELRHSLRLPLYSFDRRCTEIKAKHRRVSQNYWNMEIDIFYCLPLNAIIFCSNLCKRNIIRLGSPIRSTMSYQSSAWADHSRFKWNLGQASEHGKMEKWGQIFRRAFKSDVRDITTFERGLCSEVDLHSVSFCGHHIPNNAPSHFWISRWR